jgi:predicted ATPase
MGNDGDRTFGDLLKAWRSAAGLTHEELAARARLSVRGISDLERGLIRRPRPETVRLLADALALTPADRGRLEAAARPRGSPPESGRLVPHHDATSAACDVASRHNLPLELTSFVGHADDLAQLAQRLRAPEGGRLVTLTGAGGCGKTRLALRVALHCKDAYPDGLCFVDLAPLDNPALVDQSVAVMLGVVDSGRDAAATLLAAALRPRHLLLILDNCEHLVDAVARLVASLLQVCPHVRILATSREALRVPGEVAWRVRSLRVPPLLPLSSDTGTPRVDSQADDVMAALVSESEAVQLFVERAKAVVPDFRLTGDNAVAIAQVCRRLDGLPLAIELAAARLTLLSVDQLAARLEDRFRLLSGGSRTAPRRHQTLRALIDASYELLAPVERALLRRLAVFAGGWTLLEAVEAVGAEPAGAVGPAEETGTWPQASDTVLDVLGRLVDKSLVQVDDVSGTRHYRLLETVRYYAAEKLRASGELVAVRNRHCDWYLALSDVAYRELNGRHHGVWMRRLSAEHDNLRAALAWCRQSPDGPEKGLRLAANIGWYFLSAHRFGEGCQWLDEYLALVPRRDMVRARALEAIARIHSHDGNVPAAWARSAEFLAVAREVGDERLLLAAEAQQALVEASAGHYPAAQARLERCVAQARGDVAARYLWTLNLGLVAIAAGDDGRARPLLQEALRLARRTGIAGFAAMVLLRLSILDRLEGDYARALRELEECCTIFQEAHIVEDHTLTGRGNLARAQGHFAEAHTQLTEALRRAYRRGDRRAVAEKLGWLGVLAVAEGDPTQGVRLMVAARTENPTIAAIHVPDARREVEAGLALARTLLGERYFARAWAAGQAMTLEQAVAGALEEDMVPAGCAPGSSLRPMEAAGHTQPTPSPHTMAAPSAEDAVPDGPVGAGLAGRRESGLETGG